MSQTHDDHYGDDTAEWIILDGGSDVSLLRTRFVADEGNVFNIFNMLFEIVKVELSQSQELASLPYRLKISVLRMLFFDISLLLVL